MNKNDNLVKGEEAHKLTAEEQSMGGKASGASRRAKKDLRRALEALLEGNVTVTDKNGATRRISGTEAITTKLFEQAMKGNVKAFRTIRETVGQDPVQKIAVSDVPADVIEEIENAVLENE